MQAIEKVSARRSQSECKICRGFKLIFMDFSMPVMTGFECTAKIRELEMQWSKDAGSGIVDEPSYIVGLSAHSND